jgi:hypothetical protein
MSPIAGISIYFTLYHVFWAALMLAAFYAYIYLDVHTSSILIEGKDITFFHFWRRKWSCNISDVICRSEKGGDLDLLPVLAIRNKHTKKIVGIIKKTYFSKRSIDSIVETISSTVDG